MQVLLNLLCCRISSFCCLKFFGLLGFRFFLSWYTRCRLLATGGYTPPSFYGQLNTQPFLQVRHLWAKEIHLLFRSNSQVSILRWNNVAKKALERGAAIAPSQVNSPRSWYPRATQGPWRGRYMGVKGESTRQCQHSLSTDTSAAGSLK